MLSEVLRFEVRYHARQPAFLAAVALFVLFGFALASGRFGADNVAVNGPYLILQAFALQSLAALFAAGVFAAQAVLRDDDHRMREIIHATPVGSFPYLIGRWGGAFLATLAVLACAGLGTVVGALMPWVPAERLVAWDVRPFLAAFGTITIPNVLFVSVVLFAVAVLTRSAIATHAAAVSLYALYFVCAALTDSPLLAGARPGGGGGALAALLDPFGLTGVFDVTRYWTAAEKNARLLPLEGVLLLNRGLWVAAALGILALVHRRFSFRMRNEPAAKTDRQGEEAPASGPAARPWSALPKLHPVPASGLAAYRSCVQVELRSLGTKSTWFLLLVWIAWAFSEIYGGLAGDYRSVSYPATSLLLAALQTPAAVAGSLLLLYFAAELFWREQRVRMAPLADGTPVSGAVLLAAKGTALAALLGAVLLTGAAAGLAIQLGRGFFQIEPGLYLAFFYFTGAPLLLYAAAALFIHALSPGKYAGMILSAAFLILSRRAAAFGLEHDLWRFAGTPPVRYSALNGFAQDATAFHAFLLHWAVLALLLAVLAAGLWRRVGSPLCDRLPLLLRPGRTAGGLAVLSLVTGGWIFYNTNVATAYVTASDLNAWKADYEKTYKSLEALPRPRVLAIDGEVDLFPASGRYRVAGRYVLANETRQPIATVYVATRREAGRVALSMPGGRLVAQDERFGMTRFDLQPPLAPGARTELRFDLTFSPRGFVARQQEDSVIANGTFLLSTRGFPTLGYRGSYELSDPRERRKRGLPGASAAALEEDGPHGAVDSTLDEWVETRLTVSTSADQIALAPGNLERTWERGGRRWFRYRTGAPILNRFAISSGRYAVARRQQGHVALELYHHPAHAANVAHMLDGAAAAVDLMERRFGRYPHRQLRIVEIPSYQPMAGFALPEAVYLREDRGFLTDTRDPSRPDLVARRVAHEVAHQWFGHRVHVTDQEGAAVIVESLTKYAELLVVERLRGREHVRQLLEIELDRYLAGRAADSYPEVALYKADRQAYLYYNKAAVVLFGLRDLLGEAAVDHAIRGLMQEPRPTSLALVRHLLAVAKPEQRPVVASWLREIVLYDLRVAAASAHRRADGRYDVTLQIAAGRSRVDARGTEQPLPLHEPIEIALTAEGKVLDSRKHVLRPGMNVIRVTLEARPAEVTVDPWITRIDRNPVDNGQGF